MTIFLSIKYDEVSQDSYEGFEITINYHKKEEKHVINSGDPVADHKAVYRYLIEKFPENFEDLTIMESSTLTHFVFDGDKYGYNKETGMLERRENNILVIEKLIWTFYQLEEVTQEITGKYLFFSSDRDLLISIAKTEIQKHDFQAAKVSKPKETDDEFVLCLFYKDDSRRVELRKRYKESDTLKYRWWKSNEKTFQEWGLEED